MTSHRDSTYYYGPFVQMVDRDIIVTLPGGHCISLGRWQRGLEGGHTCDEDRLARIYRWRILRCRLIGARCLQSSLEKREGVGVGERDRQEQRGVKDKRVW